MNPTMEGFPGNIEKISTKREGCFQEEVVKVAEGSSRYGVDEDDLKKDHHVKVKRDSLVPEKSQQSSNSQSPDELEFFEMEHPKSDDSKENSNGGDIGPEEFRRILEERKAERKERAEHKRLEGLRQIQERTSRTGVDPLEYFPSEMWDKVLDELNPMDKANLKNVHPLFCELMKTNQIRDIYFPLLLDHNTDFIKKYFHDPSSNPDVLKLRLVSKSIQNAVDHWFERMLNKFLRPPSEDPWTRFKSLPKWPKMAFKLEMSFGEETLPDILEIQRPMKIFQRQFQIVIQGPSSRSNINEEEHERLQSFNVFTDNIIKALEQIGDQIWHFEFYSEQIENFGVTRSHLFSFLKEWLVLLPNLKFLDICFNACPFLGGLFEPIDRSLLRQPFPTFPSLERLDFTVDGDYDLSLICRPIIRSNPHIKILNYSGLPGDFYRYLAKPRIQAMELEMCEIGYEDYLSEWVEFRTVAPIILNSNWNLKMLNLCIIASGSRISTILRFLNCLPTLQDVTLRMDLVTFSSSKNIEYLQLPNLRYFALEFENIFLTSKWNYRRNIHFFCCLQFLLYSKKLQYLRCKWAHIPRQSRKLLRNIYLHGPPEGMLDFCGGFKDLTHSNLWDAFPLLEEIDLEWDHVCMAH